ncbi:MAG TPA: glycosyltransferase family 39 protein, partial [Pyrinomonadaceae bacterium]|nr:glycosyltransferase family 39 protein [Pyrinomonadaceae bacterium]
MRALTSSPRVAESVAALLLLALGASLLLAASRKSVTIDEEVLIPAGFQHLARGDFRPVNEHPPLAPALAAAPLLVLGVEAPRLEGLGLSEAQQSAHFSVPFWRANAGALRAVSFWARVPAVLLTLALGALLFVYTRRLFGPLAAVFAVALFTCEPTVLAHGRVAHTDIPSALGLLLFCHALRSYAREPRARRALLVGLACGLAVLTKFSMLALAPLLLAAGVVWVWRAPRRELPRRQVLRHFAVALLAAWVTLHAGYYFDGRALESSELARVEAGGDGDSAASALRLAARVLPADFVAGVGYQIAHNREGHQAFLLGEYRTRGWWYYFPVAFALKTSLPFLMLTLASVAWAAWRVRHGEREFLYALAPPLLFFALASATAINIGVRYVLPALPFLCALGGALLARLWGARRGRAPCALVALACVGWMALEAWLAFPHYMPYVNQLARARPGWTYLSDSNVEWGDDVGALAAYLHERGETRVTAAVLSERMLSYHGIEVVSPYDGAGAGGRPRYTAVGASHLNGSTVPWT